MALAAHVLGQTPSSRRPLWHAPHAFRFEDPSARRVEAASRPRCAVRRAPPGPPTAPAAALRSAWSCPRHRVGSTTLAGSAHEYIRLPVGSPPKCACVSAPARGAPRRVVVTPSRPRAAGVGDSQTLRPVSPTASRSAELVYCTMYEKVFGISVTLKFFRPARVDVGAHHGSPRFRTAPERRRSARAGPPSSTREILPYGSRGAREMRVSFFRRCPRAGRSRWRASSPARRPPV